MAPLSTRRIVLTKLLSGLATPEAAVAVILAMGVVRGWFSGAGWGGTVIAGFVSLLFLVFTYAMGAAQLNTVPLLQQVARDRLGLSARDLQGRPFNQLKNYVWSQLGQIPLYEILVREGFDAASATVLRLVSRG